MDRRMSNRFRAAAVTAATLASLAGAGAVPVLADTTIPIPPASVPLFQCGIKEYGGSVVLGGFGLIPTVKVTPPTLDDTFDISHCILLNATGA